MPRRSDDQAFRGWATRLFDAAVGAQIYSLAMDAPPDGAPASVRVARLAWLFKNAALFANRSPAHVGQAVWCLASEVDGELRFLHDSAVPVEVRGEAAASISLLFEKLLARVCTPTLGHTMKAEDSDDRAGWANMACYMFWDICPVGPRSREVGSTVIDAACLQAMERTLAVSHIACQESALHGLGHWQDAYPERVRAIIDGFLRKKHGAPEVLRHYGKQARAGHVL